MLQAKVRGRFLGLIAGVGSFLLFSAPAHPGARAVAVLPVKQVLEQEAAVSDSNEQFAYLLTADGDAPLPEGAGADGYDFFLQGNTVRELELSFSRVGIYRYHIRQLAPAVEKGWTHDQEEYTIDVYIKNGESDSLRYELVLRNREGNKPAAVVFTNALEKKKQLPQKKPTEVKTGDTSNLRGWLIGLGLTFSLTLLLLISRCRQKAKED